MNLQAIKTIALGEIGVTEVPGDGNNDRIVKYHATTSIGASDDAVPWCSSFVNWCVEQAGYAGTGSPAARSWLKWGKAIDKPVPGCIVVLSRGTKSWQGHVGFFIEEDPSRIKILGGNQSNSVNEQWFPKSKVLGFRRPMQVKDSKTVGTSMIGTIVAGTGAAIHTFPKEIVDNANNIGGAFPPDWKSWVIGGLVIAGFVYVAIERIKKIDRQQV